MSSDDGGPDQLRVQDPERLRELSYAMMDGVASEEQARELAEWLKQDSAARDEYLTLVDLHATLASDLGHCLSDSNKQYEVQSDQPSPEPGSMPTETQGSKSKRVQMLGLAALAASLLIGATWFFQDDPGATNGSEFANTREDTSTDGSQNKSTIADQATFASVIQLSRAEWGSEQKLRVGERLSAGTIALEQGFVLIAFDDGVEVTLEGPAEYQLLEIGQTILHSGLLTATVPPGAEGFTVETPTAEVVDLGTSFGIDLREDGYSRVSVFDGEVEVAAPEAEEKMLLTEGDSVRIGEDQQIQEVEFDPIRFAKVWPIASGITGSSEAFRFVPPWPPRISLVSSDSDIFVAKECYSKDLAFDLSVNVSEPGTVTTLEDLSPNKIQQGRRIRSYILHYAPTTNLNPRRATKLKGSITFDRPILGLIVMHEELKASSRRFSRRAAGESQHRRQLDFTGEKARDRITLSDDMRTLDVELISPGRSSDLIRVIVESSGRLAARPRRSRNQRLDELSN
ncbi:MAG: FecR domain-containing protein [Planctomycetota bacterium]